ncbi:MAG: hypothetical protein MUF19_03220 [Candidatus Pacebacteria bacterium]|jgi:hypothetical protein|nr:hypothetical protein [Candidatus Paceibacterota bacterium]
MSDLFKAMLGFLAAPVLIVIGILVMRTTFEIMGVNFEPVLSIVIALTPIWLPFLLFWLLYEKWMEYVKHKFMHQQGRTTLRIKLPSEVFKSPEAMENVLAQVHNVQSPDNLWQTYIDGKHPLVMSLEIVSIGGDVRLYINCPTKKVKNAVESQLYAQYPGVEVVEEEIDYTAAITPDLSQHDLFAFWMKQKGDEEFPIRTYIDMGMDKLPKEEFKLDPMAAMIEHLGTCKPYEHIWIQFLCIPHAKKAFKTGYFHETATWEGRVRAKIDEMMGRGKDKKGPAELENQPRLTPGERSVIEAMERNMSKYAYEVGIRWVYATKKGAFDGNMISPTIRSFAAYDLIGRNQIGVAWRTDYDYNWFSDWSGKKKAKLKIREFNKFKHRAPSHGNALQPSMPMQIMSVEELATVFHIPSSTVMTPGLGRIPSTRKEAPPNLPTGDFAQ